MIGEALTTNMKLFIRNVVWRDTDYKLKEILTYDQRHSVTKYLWQKLPWHLRFTWSYNVWHSRRRFRRRVLASDASRYLYGPFLGELS